MDKKRNGWKITAIIFIVLFVLALLAIGANSSAVSSDTQLNYYRNMTLTFCGMSQVEYGIINATTPDFVASLDPSTRHTLEQDCNSWLLPGD